MSTIFVYLLLVIYCSKYIYYCRKWWMKMKFVLDLVQGDKMKREEIDRIFDEMIDSIPKIKIRTFVSRLKLKATNK